MAMQCLSAVSVMAVLSVVVSGYHVPIVQKPPVERVEAWQGQGGMFTEWAAEKVEKPEPPRSWNRNPFVIGLSMGLIAAFLTACPAPSLASDWDHTDIPAWSKKFPMCSATSQSPIDIVTSGVDESQANQNLKEFLKYKSQDMREIVHNGHVMQVNGGFGAFSLPDGEYEVKQFHFHFPAEHSVNGKLAAGELHIVHQRKGASGTDGLAVFGIILEQSLDVKNSPEADLLKQLGFEESLPSDGSKNKISGSVDLNAFKSQIEGGFYHYSGSLTTPPCAENVHWYVAKKTAPVTETMIKNFRSRFPDPGDNRPVQGLNGRKVLLNRVELPREFVPAPVLPELKAAENKIFADFSKKINDSYELQIKALEADAAARKKAIDEAAAAKKAQLLSKKNEKIEDAAAKSKLAAEARAAAQAAQAAAEKIEQELLRLEL